jgi:hypothetical protein
VVGEREDTAWRLSELRKVGVARRLAELDFVVDIYSSRDKDTEDTNMHNIPLRTRGMPISADAFDELESKTNAERVVEFLAENDDKAFKASEIAEATGVDENSVHPVLKRLRERGLARHKPPHWTMGDEEWYVSMNSTLCRFLDGREEQHEVRVDKRARDGVPCLIKRLRGSRGGRINKDKNCLGS